MPKFKVGIKTTGFATKFIEAPDTKALYQYLNGELEDGGGGVSEYDYDGGCDDEKTQWILQIDPVEVELVEDDEKEDCIAKDGSENQG